MIKDEVVLPEDIYVHSIRHITEKGNNWSEPFIVAYGRIFIGRNEEVVTRGMAIAMWPYISAQIQIATGRNIVDADSAIRGAVTKRRAVNLVLKYYVRLSGHELHRIHMEFRWHNLTPKIKK